MTVFKSSNISVEIKNGKVDIGDVGVKFYTQDINTTLLNIRVLKDEQFLNFNDEQYKPFINLFMGDGSVFLDQPVEISDAENGLLTYKLAEKVKHAGWVKFKLILKKEDESLHAANFKLEILDSGLESEIGRVIDVDILMNAFERFALKYPEKIRGKAFTFEDFTEEQLALLKGPKGDDGPKGEPGTDGKDGANGKSAYELALANGFKGSESEWLASLKGKDGINIVPDGSITTSKVSNNAVTPEKTSFMIKSKNLFDGNYIKGSMGLSGSTMRVSNLQTLTGSIVIIPIKPNVTYTVKIHDIENSDILRVGVHNSEIPKNTGFINMDRFVYQNLITKQTTFTNDSNGKVMVVQVSTNGQKPRLQIEESEYATDYVAGYVLDPQHIVLNKVGESKKEPDYTPEVFKNAFEKKSQGTEKSKVTNLINYRHALDSNTVVTEDEGKKGGFDKSIKFDVEAGKTSYVQRTLPVNERIEHVHTVGISIRQDILNDGDLIIVNLTGENGSVNIPFSKSDLALDGITRKAGWDLLRMRFDYASNASKNIGKIKTIRFSFVAKEKTTIYIDNIWVESFEKAKIIFIHDGGYQAFFNKGQAGYYDLEKRNIPMTLASIPAKIYDKENTRFISGEFLKELSLKNNNEISIHSWDGEDSIATKSESEMYEESLKAISMLHDHGHEVLWRAAFLRNTAPGSAGAKPLFHSFAFSTAYSMIEQVEGFPFVAPYNVRRFQLHQRTNETLDLWFEKLKNSRGVWVVYTHNVSNANTGDITPESWEYFLEKLDTALSEGWLEGATFKSLMSAYL